LQLQFDHETPWGTLVVDVRRNPRRSKRLGITFDASGLVLIDAPPSVRMPEIETVVAEHMRWLWRRSEAARDSVDGMTPPEFGAESVHHYLGSTLTLRVAPHVEPVRVDDEYLWVTSTQPIAIQRALRTWYAARADEVLQEHLRVAVDKVEWLDAVPPWRHRFMRSQWGSCSAKGRLSLNTHLVKVPEALIEYVVLHELCHLRHLNHGARFRGLLARYVPTWEARRRALGKYSALLMEEAQEQDSEDVLVPASHD
jgi:predicted metal-dependent hydrolase